MGVIYRFGEFELDAARFELRLRGACADVQPKVLRLLLHLVEHRDRAVSNDELLRALWPEMRVTAGSIKRAVLGARQALGERGEESRIRTVRGFGYQFVDDVIVEGVAPPVAPAPAPVLRSTRASVREALLGREGVMDLLQESLQQALDGVCRCVLITGGPGLGKTRTIEELLADAQQLGADTWMGRCTEVEGAPAFWPFIQVMREALRARGPAELRTLLGSEGADLAGAFSELREQWPDLPEAAPLSSNSVRFRLYDSMAVFLQRAALARPIVLALDDLHRADPASLRLLIFVVRQVKHAPILILGALRSELPSSPETLQLLEELKAASRCVALSGLTEPDIARYVQLATGAEPPSNVSELLHAQTAGNPLFLQHVVENWRVTAERTGQPSWQGLPTARMSEGLSGAIVRHLELVSLPCRELLRVAAVLGREFSAGILSQVAEQAAADSSSHLAEASASGLIQELASELGRFRFTHVLVRDALYAQLSAAQRTALHYRAASALEAQGIGDNGVLLAEVTRHFIQAAPTDSERALHYTLRAAELALRTLAYEQAAAHFDAALDLLQYRAPDPAMRMSLLFRKGDALARVDMPAASEELFQAAALAREHGDRDLFARAAMLIASRPESGRVDAPKVDVLRQALSMLDDNDRQDERYALLQSLLAKALLYDTELHERAGLARAALARARELRAPAQIAEVLTRCHEALPDPQHVEERLGIATELMNLATGTGDTISLLNAYAAQVETCMERGDMDGADAAIDNVDLLAARVREPYYRWFSKIIHAVRAFVRGDIAGSDELLHEAWRNSQAISTELARNIYHAQWVPVLRMRGQLRECEPILREMMLNFPAVPGWSAAWGAMIWDLGQHDQARTCLDRLMARGAEHIRGEPSGLGNCAALSELCAKVGDGVAAKQIYGVLLPFQDYHGLTTFGSSTYGPLHRYLAELARCFGDDVSAERHYRAALVHAERMHSPVYVGAASYAYARMLLRDGDARRRSRAIELVSNALRLSDQHPLHSIAHACQRLAKRHGLSTERRTGNGK